MLACLTALLSLWARDTTIIYDTVRAPGVEEQFHVTEDSPVPDLLEPDPAEDGITIRARCGTKFQLSRGFEKHLYAGSPLRAYQRVKFRRGFLAAGIVAEKDPGEVRLNDFTSGFAMISPAGGMKIVLGDYVVSSGQGIAFWPGVALSKGAEVIAPSYRRAGGLKPYASSGEFSFLRGAAAEFRPGPLSATLIFSRMSRTAIVDGSGAITGFSTSGYFRTESEISRRNNTEEKLLGLAMQLDTGIFAFGLTLSASRFDRPFRLPGGSYADGALTVGAASYSIRLPDAVLFGEWGRGNGSTAGISGLLISPVPGTDILVTYRSSSPDFISLHGLPFGEQSHERGLYAAARAHLKGLRLSSFVDVFTRPALFPLSSHEFFIQGELLSGQLSFTLRYHASSSEEFFSYNDGGNFASTAVRTRNKRRMRVVADYSRARTELRALAEGSLFSAAGRREKGILISQDVLLHPSRRVAVNVRLCLFGINSIDTEIPESERDIPGVFNSPLLEGTGSRWYILAKFTPSDFLEFTAKYSELVRDDVKRIGSGLEELPGNVEDRVGIQLDLRF